MAWMRPGRSVHDTVSTYSVPGATVAAAMIWMLLPDKTPGSRGARPGGVPGRGHRVADDPHVGYRADPAGNGRDGPHPGDDRVVVHVADQAAVPGRRIGDLVDSDIEDHRALADVLGLDQPGHAGGDDEDIGTAGMEAEPARAAGPLINRLHRRPPGGSPGQGPPSDGGGPAPHG